MLPFRFRLASCALEDLQDRHRIPRIHRQRPLTADRRDEPLVVSESGDRRKWRPRLRLGPRPRSRAAQIEDRLRDAFAMERIHPERRLEKIRRWFERDPITGHWPVLFHREKVEMQPAEVFRAFYKTIEITGTSPASLKPDRRATAPRA